MRQRRFNRRGPRAADAGHVRVHALTGEFWYVVSRSAAGHVWEIAYRIVHTERDRRLTFGEARIYPKLSARLDRPGDWAGSDAAEQMKEFHTSGALEQIWDHPSGKTALAHRIEELDAALARINEVVVVPLGGVPSGLLNLPVKGHLAAAARQINAARSTGATNWGGDRLPLPPLTPSSAPFRRRPGRPRKDDKQTKRSRRDSLLEIVAAVDEASRHGNAHRPYAAAAQGLHLQPNTLQKKVLEARRLGLAKKPKKQRSAAGEFTAKGRREYEAMLAREGKGKS